MLHNLYRPYLLSTLFLQQLVKRSIQYSHSFVQVSHGIFERTSKTLAFAAQTRQFRHWTAQAVADKLGQRCGEARLGLALHSSIFSN